ncbi:MAG: DUF1003 domain-containing protein [Actinomycetota bacterium]|nr:DUF1003 domain-containing protein [Actinomycetota bacterium]
MNVFRTPVRTPGDQARNPDRRSLHPANQFRHDQRNFGQRLADSVTGVFGSWRFIIVQTIIVSAWIGLNVVAFGQHWDPYPFILLNLMFSTQAAYAAPLILLSQNRQADTDRVKAEHDYQVNQLALQYLIAWHRDAHGDGCDCVRESEPAVQAALASIARGVGRPQTVPARKS